MSFLKRLRNAIKGNGEKEILLRVNTMLSNAMPKVDEIHTLTRRYVDAINSVPEKDLSQMCVGCPHKLMRRKSRGRG